MKEQDIIWNDWARIFAGDLPFDFYVELIIRTAFLFLLLLLSMRLMGKRMAAQLSRNDMAAMVSLAAAIGVPVLAADRGLIPSTITAFIVVGVTRLSAVINFKEKDVEELIVGDVDAIAEDGSLNIDVMRKVQLPVERVAAQLRTHGIVHLGEVKRLYLESTGDFSLIKAPEPRPGLLLLPDFDKEFAQQRVHYTDADICKRCGFLRESSKKLNKRCRRCGNKGFEKAVIGN